MIFIVWWIYISSLEKVVEFQLDDVTGAGCLVLCDVSLYVNMVLGLSLSLGHCVVVLY